MQVCTLLQTDNHASTPLLSFLQAGCPSCRPTDSVKALKAQGYFLEISCKLVRPDLYTPCITIKMTDDGNVLDRGSLRLACCRRLALYFFFFGSGDFSSLLYNWTEVPSPSKVTIKKLVGSHAVIA